VKELLVQNSEFD